MRGCKGQRAGGWIEPSISFKKKFLLFLLLCLLFPLSIHPDQMESLFQKKCRILFKGKKGCMMALNPKTGKILSLVNPECVFGESYPPGSLFKLVTAGAALSNNVIDEAHEGNCHGKEKLRGKTFQCWLKKGHGKLTLKQALAYSCNIYFYKLGAKLKPSWILDFARAFGFGQTTRSGMPGEVEGGLPHGFTPQEQVSFAVGEHEELDVTPAQVAVFLSAIANGGSRIKPSFSPRAPEPVEDVAHLKPVLSFLSSAMRESVQYGTCKELLSLKRNVAGKTGTARQRKGFRTHAWFTGFYPAQNPEISLVVFLERGEGRKDAVPLAKQIFKEYFESAGSL